MKKLYGVGTGPGDKELLTLKAVRVIRDAEVIFAPNNRGKNMALDTAKDYIGNKRIVLIDFHMGEVDRTDYKTASEIIKNEISNGEHGVFLTIGDPMIYSTFIFIMKELEGSDVEVEIVPGIPSFVAGAGISKTPIGVKGEKFLLCDEEPEAELLKSVDCVCILKAFKDKKKIIDIFDDEGFAYNYIKRCTLENEKVLTDKEKILKERDYMSFMMGRRIKND